MKFLLSLQMSAYHRRLVRRLTRDRRELTERFVEYSYVLSNLRLAPGIVALDVGSGETAFPRVLHDCGCVVTAVDGRPRLPRKGGLFNPHFDVRHDDITRSRLPSAQFDLVTCVSVLEHIRDADAAVAEMARVTKPGGVVILTFPFRESEFVENVYEKGTFRPGFICRMYSRANIQQWCAVTHQQLVDQALYRCWDGEYWRLGRRLRAPLQTTADGHHDLTCIVLKNP